MAFALRRRSVLAAVCLLATQAAAGSLAAWYTDLGPSLLLQDDETSHVRYSLCTSENTPILPEDKTIIAPLYKYQPRNGTALAGTGWYDSKITWASIFYQDTNDNIVNSYLKCDPNTGYWLSQGDYIISGNAPSVATGTGLAAVLLGSTGGYRVFYHDTDMTIRQIGYTTDSGWDDIGAVTQDGSLGNAIGAVYSGKKSNITVAAATGSNDIEISQWFDDDSWHISAFPQPLSGDLVTNATNATSIALNTTSAANFTLPAWDGTASSLGVSTHHSGTRSIFYIGTDSALHQASQSGSDDAWRIEASPNATFWPSPDAAARGQLAVASDGQNGQLRVYYQSGGQIVELNGDGLDWTIAAAALPNANSTASSGGSSNGGSDSSGSTGDSNGDGSSSSSSSNNSNGGLSTGAKVGVGVGVSISAVAVVGILGGLFFLRKRQQRRNKESTFGGSTLAGGSSMAPTPNMGYATAAYPNHVSPQTAYPPYGELDQTTYNQSNGWETYYSQPHVTPKQPGELETGAPAAQEMPQNFRYHEMVGEGHYREAP